MNDYDWFNILKKSIDNHVQRIWSDQTPLRSPGAPSPRPWSPENRRRMPAIQCNPSKVAMAPPAPPNYPTQSSTYFQRSSAHHRRKDKVSIRHPWLLAQFLIFFYLKNRQLWLFGVSKLKILTFWPLWPYQTQILD